MENRYLIIFSMIWIILVFILFGVLAAQSPKKETFKNIKGFESNLREEVGEILKFPVPKLNLHQGFTYCENTYVTSSWFDNDKGVMYKTYGTRENNSSNVKGFSVFIYVDETLPYDGHEKDYSNQANKVLGYIEDLTFLKNLDLKEIVVGEYSLDRYEKESKYYKGDYKFVETSARTLYFKEYNKRGLPFELGSQWPKDPRGAQKCYYSGVKSFEIFFDYENDGSIDEILKLDKEGYKPLLMNSSLIFSKMLLKQGDFTIEEWEEAQEWRGRNLDSIFHSGGAGATISIPDSNDHFVNNRIGSSYCNYVMKFENEDYEIEVGAGDLIEISIRRKN